ncbi:MAG: single-stranded DNA-binding protein [Ruminococcus sp.]|nr:single-stranded DNA-binding protein [Ruminococcus sp.]
MLNQAVIVARICSEIKLKETKNGKTIAVLDLAVPRCFKNKDGGYDTDFVSCTLFDNIAQNTADYLKIGDIVGIKGRLARLDKESPLELVAEKVSFLSSKCEA